MIRNNKIWIFIFMFFGCVAFNLGLAKFPDDAGLNNGLEEVRKVLKIMNKLVILCDNLIYMSKMWVLWKVKQSQTASNPMGSLFTPESLQRLAGHPTIGLLMRYSEYGGYVAYCEFI